MSTKVWWIVTWEHRWRPGAKWIGDGMLYEKETDAIQTLANISLKSGEAYYRNIRGPFRWTEPLPQEVKP